jgi:hypothetical protein
MAQAARDAHSVEAADLGERLAELRARWRSIDPSWMIGESLDQDRRREYVAHLEAPRFIARIVAIDLDGQPEPHEQPADLTSGAVLRIDEQNVLCEIDWIDAASSGLSRSMLRMGAQQIERFYAAAAAE